MPEGPEVTIIRENLNQELKGALVTEWEIYPTSRYREKAPDNFLDFESHFPIKINSVDSKGKLIYFNFEDNFTLLNTLGMSGYWSYTSEKHTSIKMTFRKKNRQRALYFNDQRHFGTLKFLKTKTELEKKLSEIGPDMLNDKDMSFEKFETRLKKWKNWNICKAIMCQKIISGVGNYLKSESLYLARISPFKKISELTQVELESLYQAIRVKVVGSYNEGGVSVRHFKDVKDKKGQYQFRLEVYCRDRDPMGNKVVRVETDDKRSTYYVPKLQK